MAVALTSVTQESAYTNSEYEGGCVQGEGKLRSSTTREVMVYGHRESRKAGSKAKRKEQRHRKGHTTQALPPVHPPIKSTIGKQPHRNIEGKILRGPYKSYSANPNRTWNRSALTQHHTAGPFSSLKYAAISANSTRPRRCCFYSRENNLEKSSHDLTWHISNTWHSTLDSSL